MYCRSYFFSEVQGTFDFLINSCWAWEIHNFSLHLPGQIIAISHDLTPNGGLVREISYFREI